MMGPAAYSAIGNPSELKEKAHSLFDQAMEQGLNVEEIADIIAKADALLERAEKIKRANPIPASNMAREAAQLYESVISNLEALLGRPFLFFLLTIHYFQIPVNRFWKISDYT